MVVVGVEGVCQLLSNCFEREDLILVGCVAEECVDIVDLELEDQGFGLGIHRC